jgi:hypothetical protein
MNKFEELVDLIERIKASGDIRKFYERNNSTAGIRLRLHMQEIKAAAQDVRIEISEIKTVRESKKSKK